MKTEYETILDVQMEEKKVVSDIEVGPCTAYGVINKWAMMSSLHQL